jgi:hypothetical protein
VKNVSSHFSKTIFGCFDCNDTDRLEGAGEPCRFDGVCEGMGVQEGTEDGDEHVISVLIVAVVVVEIRNCEAKGVLLEGRRSPFCT